MATDCCLIALCRPLARSYSNHWQLSEDIDGTGEDEGDRLREGQNRRRGEMSRVRGREKTARYTSEYSTLSKTKTLKLSVSRSIQEMLSCSHDLTINHLSWSNVTAAATLHLKAPLTRYSKRSQSELAAVVLPSSHKHRFLS